MWEGEKNPLKSILFWSKLLMDYKLKRIFYNQNSHHVFLPQGQSLGLVPPSLPTMLGEHEAVGEEMF